MACESVADETANVPVNKVSIKCRYHMYDRKLLFFSLAFHRTKVQFIQAQRARSRRILKRAFAGNVLSEATAPPVRAALSLPVKYAMQWCCEKHFSSNIITQCLM